MPAPDADQRSAARRAHDEQIADEPQKAPLELPKDANCSPFESHLARIRRPVALAGIVENGVVRPLDPTVRLAERARVIIVTSE